MSTTFGVLRFPGSNCDDDALHIVSQVLSESDCKGRMLWHKDSALGDVDGLIVPGGFSYGDYLRAGAMAAHAPIMAAVVEFAKSGGPVLGICNGFQILCEAGLLEGSLSRNDGLRFVCKDVYCRVEGKPTPFTQAIPVGRHIRMPIAHSEGRYAHPDVETLEANGQVVFRYCDSEGTPSESANPNGSVNNIAGVCNPSGNVVGLMPHPERACEAILGGGGVAGLSLFESALAFLTNSSARVGTGK
ncbi:MAG: phosphoribosylformylglycinamidine synthase subunit PurQ [Kofleriaceae bacterium]|nr:phosphoribosylformylglycinamidine synthase subunit PurQ [Kofleriaceae bacterium]